MVKKNIVVGVTGGVAVYKAVDVVSRLKKKNYEVNVIMTKSAQEFVQPLTFQAISQNYVVSDMFDEPKTWDVEHIALAQKADIFLIVPATANIIGKVAGGICDDMLSTTIMATKAPVVFAPAMNTNMLNNVIVQDNIKKLEDLGYLFIEPKEGRLACGDFGKGKLSDPETIVAEVENILNNKRDLTGKKVLVTAGPTREAIDPVRYITNHSSGKMGYAIAARAEERGAEVTLISGPTSLQKPPGVRLINIATTNEMYKEVLDEFHDADIIIKAAAVADYRPANISKTKIKKNDHALSIQLERNPDILMTLGKKKNHKQVLIGFAAETDELIANATKKINNKNLDFIVANDITREGAGFNSDTNIVTIIDKHGHSNQFEKMSKSDLANKILDKAIDMGKE